MLKKISNQRIDLEIFVLVPLSTQGSGKTFFYENIFEPFFEKQPNLHLKLLSSDNVNLRLVKEYQRTHPHASKTKAFEETRGKNKNAYEDEIRNIFRSIYEDVINDPPFQKMKKIFFIYIDKNHPLNESSQDNVHSKIKRISEFDNLKFISLNLLNRRYCKFTNKLINFVDPKK